MRAVMYEFCLCDCKCPRVWRRRNARVCMYAYNCLVLYARVNVWVILHMCVCVSSNYERVKWLYFASILNVS